jgi:hypothetical protein
MSTDQGKAVRDEKGSFWWKRSRGEFAGKDGGNYRRIGVYRRDTTGHENFVEKMIRAALEYNKYEAKR